METLMSIFIALGLSLGIHEGGHVATAVATGGEVTGYNITSVEFTGGADEVYLGSFAAQYVALHSLTKYRNANPEKDNQVLEYMTWLSLADLPINCIASQIDDSNDVAKWSEATGNSQGWMAGVAALQTYLYFNDVKNLSLRMEDKGVMAVFTGKF